MLHHTYCDNFGKNAVAQKSHAFAIRTIKLYKYLCNTQCEYVISKQILRSGTSIGANVAEAECAISKNDFLAKMYIAFKETVETMYWLDLLVETEYITNSDYCSIQRDCAELKNFCHL